MPGQQDLFLAAENNDLELAKAALASGAKLETTNAAGETALLIAARKDATEVAEYLLKSGSVVHARDNNLRSVLHWAVNNNNHYLIILFRYYGALTIVRDTAQTTPYKLAESKGYLHLLPYLNQSNNNDLYLDRLALREDINALAIEVDVISDVGNQLITLAPKFDKQLCERIVTLAKQCLQPELLLDWDTVKIPSPKPENSSKQKSAQKPKPIDVIANIQLNDENPLFNKIKKLLTEIDKINNEPIKETGNAVIDTKNQKLKIDLSALLRNISSAYKKFRFEVCHNTGFIRQELCRGRLSVVGTSGNRYFDKGASLRIRPHLTAIKGDKEEDKLGLGGDKNAEVSAHDVFRMQDTFYKIDPSYVGINDAVCYLYDVLSAQGHVATQELVFRNKDRSVSVLGSKAATGMEFQTLIMEQPQLLENIDSFDISLHVTITALTVPSDYKGSSFFAHIINTLSKQQKEKLDCIDLDMALGVIILLNNLKNPEHNMELQSILLLFPQMNNMVDPAFRQMMLQHPPALVILKWLKLLLQREDLIKDNYIKEQLKSLDANTREALLAQLATQNFNDLLGCLKLLPDTLLKVYERLCIIFTALQNNPQLTNHQLVCAVFPIVGDFYAKLREKNKPFDAKKMLLQYNNLRNVSLEEMYADNPKFLAELGNYKKTYTDIHGSNDGITIIPNGHTELFPEGCQKVLNQIDFANIPDPLLQRTVLTQIVTDFPIIKELIIQNCKVVNHDILEKLSINNKKLQSLTLVNCHNFSASGLYAVLFNIPEIKLQLDGFSHLSSNELLNIMLYCKNLFLKINGVVYDVRKDAEKLLSIVSGLKQTNLIAALLLFSTQLSGQKGQQQVSSILHKACKSGEVKLVTDLLDAGALPDEKSIVRNEQQNEIEITPLDLAYNEYKILQNGRKNDYVNIMGALLERGAIYCNNPDEILKIILSQKDISSSLQSALLNFAKMHGILKPEYIKQLIPENITTLTLTVPAQLALSKANLNPDFIAALPTHVKHLNELDITHTKGLTGARGYLEIRKTTDANRSPVVPFRSGSNLTVSDKRPLSKEQEVCDKIVSEIKKISSLESLYMSAEQAIGLGLELNRIHEFTALYLGKIKIYITSLNLSGNKQLNLDQTALLNFLLAIFKKSNEKINAFIKHLDLDDASQSKISTYLSQSSASAAPINLDIKNVTKIAQFISQHFKQNDYDLTQFPGSEQCLLLKVCSFIKKSISLEELELCNCGLGPIEACFLASVIEDKPSLKCIKLNGNENLADTGCSILINAMTTLPKIAEVHCDGITSTQNLKDKSTTSLLSETAKAVGKLITKCSSLEKLSLRYNPFMAEGITTIANIIQSHPNMKRKSIAPLLNYLNFNETGMDEKSAILLIHSLLFFKSLQTFDLDYNPGIGDAGAETCIHLLGINRAITLLNATNIGCKLNLTTKIQDICSYNKQLLQRRKLEEFRKANQLTHSTQFTTSLCPPELSEIEELRLHQAHYQKQLLNRPQPSANSLPVAELHLLSKPKNIEDIKAKLVHKFKLIEQEGYQCSISSAKNLIKIKFEKIPATETVQVVNKEAVCQSVEHDENIETFFRQLQKLLGKLGKEEIRISASELSISNISDEKLEKIKQTLAEFKSIKVQPLAAQFSAHRGSAPGGK